MPKEYSGEEIADLVNKFNKYIDETDMPIVAEFAFKNNIRRNLLYENTILSGIREKACLKKEVYLETNGIHNKINVSMATLSLKQLGWKDKQEVENSTATVNYNMADLPVEYLERIANGESYVKVIADFEHNKKSGTSQ